VRGTFFAVGTEIEAYPASARLIADRGHTFGCHTVTHVYEDIYASTEALEEEVVRWEEIAGEAGIALGETKYFRFPGGSVGPYFTDEEAAEMKEMLAARGYLVFDWTVVTNDAVLGRREEGVTPCEYIRATFEETFARVLAEVAVWPDTPIIILMHETVPETIDLLPWMLERITRAGLSFGSLENYGRSWTHAERHS
jgi:peptidoglycan/xylan/chitin deacetylase (PgdA/CDA1 family)